MEKEGDAKGGSAGGIVLLKNKTGRGPKRALFARRSPRARAANPHGCSTHVAYLSDARQRGNRDEPTAGNNTFHPFNGCPGHHASQMERAKGPGHRHSRGRQESARNREADWLFHELFAHSHKIAGHGNGPRNPGSSQGVGSGRPNTSGMPLRKDSRSHQSTENTQPESFIQRGAALAELSKRTLSSRRAGCQAHA